MTRTDEPGCWQQQACHGLAARGWSRLLVARRAGCARALRLLPSFVRTPPAPQSRRRCRRLPLLRAQARELPQAEGAETRQAPPRNAFVTLSTGCRGRQRRREPVIAWSRLTPAVSMRPVLGSRPAWRGASRLKPLA